ncbi:hypothetical protein M5D96_002042 [Drosophila gunungcola]|uniref:Uncharacterized protein n=1 Tax=Drosophila gunungcola TaxID=103775 RepID=A0A9P9YZR5_9MUSC|nr:hypothetical protein M5D96_002042 [Drosophila gunungcola]
MEWPTAALLELLLQCQPRSQLLFGRPRARFELSVLYAHSLSTRRISNSLQMATDLAGDAMSILLWEEPFHCLDCVMQLNTQRCLRGCDS